MARNQRGERAPGQRGAGILANVRGQVLIRISHLLRRRLRTVLTPHPALSHAFAKASARRPRRGRNVRRLEVELNERFGSSSRRPEDRRKVRTTTESPNVADEARDVRTFKQATEGFPLLGVRAEALAKAWEGAG